MKNVTIPVEEEVLKRARIRALEHGTSVSRVLNDFLTQYAGLGRGADAVARALQVSKRSRSGSGDKGRQWMREDLYE